MMADKTKNKKILILSSRDAAFEGRLYHLIALNLKKAGFDITILTSQREGQPNEIANEDGIRIITFKKHPNKYIRKFHTLFSLFKKAKNLKPDIIHVTEVDAALYIGMKLKKYYQKRFGKKIKLVLESPEIWTHFYAAHVKNSFLRRLAIHIVMEWEHWMMKRHIDGVITAHELEKEYYNWQYPWIPVRKVMASVPLKDWGAPPERTGEITTFGTDGFFTLTRGMDVILGAIEILADEFPKLKYIAAGDMNEQMDRDYFKAWCDRTGLKDRVEWPGWVVRTDAVKYLDKMDIGIAASREDPHSNRIWPLNRIMYYFGRALPVLSTTRTTFSSQIIRDHEMGVITDDFSSEELAKHLRIMISNPEKTREMGKNAYKYAKAHFDVDDAIDQLLKLYRDIYTNKPYPIKSKITLRG